MILEDHFYKFQDDHLNISLAARSWKLELCTNCSNSMWTYQLPVTVDSLETHAAQLTSLMARSPAGRYTTFRPRGRTEAADVGAFAGHYRVNIFVQKGPE